MEFSSEKLYLTIYDPKQNSSGTYTCTGKNNAGSHTRHIYVTVTTPEINLTSLRYEEMVQSERQTVFVKRSSNKELHCPFKPNPNIYWYEIKFPLRNSEFIHEGKRLVNIYNK